MLGRADWLRRLFWQREGKTGAWSAEIVYILTLPCSVINVGGMGFCPP